MPRPVLAASACVALLLAAASAPAREPRRMEPWPKPAAGPSASGDPELLFTFDDGPHEEWTGRILDTLRAHDVHAVFFWTGWRLDPSRRYTPVRRRLAERALAEGHLVGNHTVHHAHLCLGKRADAEREIDDNARLLEELTGMPITWIRVPYGDRCRRIEEMLADRGLRHMHWDLDPMEWVHWSTDQTREYLQKRIRRLEGRAVVLLHDTHPQGAMALAQVLDWIPRENARRAARGQRPIRILSFADVAREQLAPGVAALVDDAWAALAALPAGFVEDLLLPLAPPPVAHGR